MKITKLQLKNYKSFSTVDINFDSFTVIVGANAAGKSNLISSFRFIKNIMLLGIDNAIALEGGIKNIINCQCEKGTPVIISFQIDFPDNVSVMKDRKGKVGLIIACLNYSFSIVPHKKGHGYRINHDELEINYKCYEINQGSGKKKFEEMYINLNPFFKAKYVRKNQKSKVTYSSELDTNNESFFSEKGFSYDSYGKFFADYINANKNELILNKLSFLLPPIFSEENFINIYDFDPKMLKHSCLMTSMTKLEESGANMAAVLQKLLKSKENRKDLTALLSNALPFVISIGIESNYDQSYSFKIKEKYSSKTYYANFLSDGTVSVIAIIIALYFEKLTNTIIIEEYFSQALQL